MARRKTKKQIEEEKNKAREKIAEYFSKADEIFNEDKVWANRYVAKARRLAMKQRIRIVRELKRRFCKHCYSFLKPSVNCRIRTHEGKVVYYCLECKKFMRFPYIKEQKAKRSKK